MYGGRWKWFDKVSRNDAGSTATMARCDEGVAGTRGEEADEGRCVFRLFSTFWKDRVRF